MKLLTSIRLTEFRNFESIELSGLKPVVFIHGPNGSGKSNLLESVSMLCQLTPLRKVKPQDLVRWGESAFNLRGKIDQSGVLEHGFSAARRFTLFNQNPEKTDEYLTHQPIVSFLPENTQIVTGDPETRRAFIDQSLSMLDPDYRNALKLYHRTLKQRNAHLKLNPKEARIWDPALVENGSLILDKRLRWIQFATGRLKPLFDLAFQAPAEIRYMNTFRIQQSIPAAFLQALEESFALDRDSGYTHAGPHRDVYELRVYGKAASEAASQGQKRFLAVAFQLALLEAWEQKTGRTPIVLLDDVLLDLDLERKRLILSRMIGNYQLFIASTDQTETAEFGSDLSILAFHDKKLQVEA